MLINQLIEVIVNHNTCIKGTSKTHLNTQGDNNLYLFIIIVDSLVIVTVH